MTVPEHVDLGGAVAAVGLRPRAGRIRGACHDAGDHTGGLVCAVLRRLLLSFFIGVHPSCRGNRFTVDILVWPGSGAAHHSGPRQALESSTSSPLCCVHYAASMFSRQGQQRLRPTRGHAERSQAVDLLLVISILPDVGHAPGRSAWDCRRSAMRSRPRRTYVWKLALVLARCGSRLTPGCACGDPGALLKLTTWPGYGRGRGTGHHDRAM